MSRLPSELRLRLAPIKTRFFSSSSPFPSLLCLRLHGYLQIDMDPSILTQSAPAPLHSAALGVDAVLSVVILVEILSLFQFVSSRGNEYKQVFQFFLIDNLTLPSKTTNIIKEIKNHIVVRRKSVGLQETIKSYQSCRKYAK